MNFRTVFQAGLDLLYPENTSAPRNGRVWDKAMLFGGQCCWGWNSRSLIKTEYEVTSPSLEKLPWT